MTSIACPRCGLGAFPPARREASVRRCATCGAQATIREFPAMHRQAGGAQRTGARRMAAGEGGRCYSHPEAAAIAVCAGCGRFMCGDCDTEWDGERLCLSCIHDRREVRREAGFVNRRLIYDNAALGLLAIPIVFFYPFFWLGIFTGPLAMYYLVRYRGASRGFVPRGRFRAVLAWALAAGTILAGLGLIASLIYVMIEFSVTAPG